MGEMYNVVISLTGILGSWQHLCCTLKRNGCSFKELNSLIWKCLLRNALVSFWCKKQSFLLLALFLSLSLLLSHLCLCYQSLMAKLSSMKIKVGQMQYEKQRMEQKCQILKV